MKIFRGFSHPLLRKPTAVSIGNWDGVHLGHQAMLKKLVLQARQRKLTSTVLTFSPHPRDFLARARNLPALAPSHISTLRDKALGLSSCGVEQLVLLRFDTLFSSMTAEDFVQNILLHSLDTQYLLVGEDFRFGAQRQGDFSLLARQAWHTESMPELQAHGVRVSSSAVRSALQAGNMEGAAHLLGRGWSISGHVVHGRKLGRELGFPTLNLRLRHGQPPTQGVFVVDVHGLDDLPLRGVANLGVRPSLEFSDINQGRMLLEVYCLDWKDRKEAYGRMVQVEILHKLHNEVRYANLDALTQGIARDVEAANAYGIQPSPSLAR